MMKIGLAQIAGLNLFLISIPGLLINFYVFYKLLKKPGNLDGFQKLCIAKTIPNIIVCLVFLTWSTPLSILNLEYTAIPRDLNATLGQIAGWGAFLMGPMIQVCVAVNRFYLLYFPIQSRRTTELPITIVSISIAFLIALFHTLIGLPKHCGYVFDAKELAWRPENFQCADILGKLNLIEVVVLAIVSNTFNFVTFIKLIFCKISLPGVLINFHVFYKLSNKSGKFDGFRKLCIAKTIPNMIVCLVFLTWSTPLCILNPEYTAIPRDLNATLGQIAGWGAFLMGPMIQVCVAVNRFYLLHFPFYSIRFSKIPITNVSIFIIFIIALFHTGIGLPHECAYVFDPENLAWRPENFTCAHSLGKMNFFEALVMSSISNALNFITFVRLIIFKVAIVNSMDSTSRRRKWILMYCQSVIQDSLHVIDMTNSMFLQRLYDAWWFQFLFLSVSFLLIHAVDGIVIFIFHSEIHPPWLRWKWEECAYVFDAEGLAWRPEEFPCALSLANVNLMVVLSLSIVSNTFNFATFFKLIFSQDTVVNMGMSKSIRRKRVLMYCQSVIQDSFHVSDMINAIFTHTLYDSLWFKFIFLSVSFLFIHVIDGFVIFIFHPEIHPTWTCRKLRAGTIHVSIFP